ncbi:uncharacterized protein N7515_004985 [Penicillium bovifimosum]|uniref:Peptidase metallopeptidase domain-containing protein n=1 Tax=Penicillium bovifimosum TaxID=126998 RepID=A0A9W9L4F8_9EURO|nr:uncharacterized protein N7515_004985 [Penicillium bovifimosum]KAJ5135707.1 hypothetical protein N7515_004985 [Penicillium bovifimosum]
MGAGPPAGLWPANKHVLNVCFLNGGEYEQNTVKSLIKKYYHSIPMRLRFKFLPGRDMSSSDIRILFSDCSKAYIGRQAESYPGQPTMWLNMYPRYPTQDAARNKVQADVLHEFGHALGLVHEHKHPHCKANWNYDRLMRRNQWGLDTVRYNYNDDTHSAVNAKWDRAYDPYSIMHYPIARGDTQSAVREVPENIVLSAIDKETLALLYPVVAVVKQHPTVHQEPTRKHEKEKREKKPKEPTKKDKKEKEARPKKEKPRQKVYIGGNDSAVVSGGYVEISGNAEATIHGSGQVVASGNSDVVVYGDSTVWASGNADVYVNGGGSATVSGNATVKFTGTGTGKVTGNGSLRWNA